MRTFVMGDVQLGDIADGFYEVYECVEELLKIRKLIAIRGNHDEWFDQFIQTAYHPVEWRQGGAATARSYLRRIGKENRMHAGFDWRQAFKGQRPGVYYWDRELLDTGGGASGRLTIMDVQSKQFWQSDPVAQLYGER